MTTLDKWDRFLYLRMMFANGYRNAENIKTIIKKEFKAADDSLLQLSRALETMKRSLEASKKEIIDTAKFPIYGKVKKRDDEDWVEEQRAGIKYWKSDGS